MVGTAGLDRPYRTLRLTQQRNDDDVRRSHDDARPVTLRGIAITGAIASGKTTLASALARRIGGRHLASDAIRHELYGERDGNAARVFRVMEERLLSAFEQNVRVVLDSTGMSYRFRDILQRYRDRLTHVHLVIQDPKTFEARESRRSDRPALPFSVFNRSKSIVFPTPPDIIIETDTRNADTVLQIVLATQKKSLVE